jgi:hypothetical protein
MRFRAKSKKHGNSEISLDMKSPDFGDLAASNIAQIQLFDFNGGSATNDNVYFNSLAINAVPEPSVVSLLAGSAILSGWRSIRRRRA